MIWQRLARCGSAPELSRSRLREGGEVAFLLELTADLGSTSSDERLATLLLLALIQAVVAMIAFLCRPERV